MLLRVYFILAAILFARPALSSCGDVLMAHWHEPKPRLTITEQLIGYLGYLFSTGDLGQTDFLNLSSSLEQNSFSNPFSAPHRRSSGVGRIHYEAFENLSRNSQLDLGRIAIWIDSVLKEEEVETQ